MVLNDREIREFLSSKKIIIEPIDMDAQVQPCSVDLRLANLFRVFKRTEKAFIDPASDGSLENCTELIETKDGKPFILHPQEFMLASTIEYLKLPDDVVGRLDGRSSLGRLGIIIHSTAGHVEPGFYGRLTLEVTNIGKMPVALYPGMRVCQISFEKLSSACEKPKNKREGAKYLGSDTPLASKITLDKELKR